MGPRSRQICADLLGALMKRCSGVKIWTPRAWMAIGGDLHRSPSDGRAGLIDPPDLGRSLRPPARVRAGPRIGSNLSRSPWASSTVHKIAMPERTSRPRLQIWAKLIWQWGQARRYRTWIRMRASDATGKRSLQYRGNVITEEPETGPPTMEVSSPPSRLR